MTGESPTEVVWPAVDLAGASRLLRSGQASCVELVKAHLHRIDRLNPVLHACITVLADEALDAAAKFDAGLERLQGSLGAPSVAGLPLGFKDNFKTAGVRTTAASRALEHYTPEDDAQVVRLLKEAGAIPIAKLNMDELALGGPFGSGVAGIMVNPWDAQSVPGGSSGGSAIAVSSGMVMAATGSDTGGSIRNPAAWCGVVGHKPSQAVVSIDGIIPVAWSLDTAGYLAHTVDDCILLLAETDTRLLTAAPERRKQFVDSATRPPPRTLRIGVAKSAFAICEEGVREPFAQAVDALDAIGALDEVVLPSLEDALLVLFVVAHSEAAAVWSRELELNPTVFGREIRAGLDAGSIFSARDYVDAQRMRSALRKSVTRLFGQFDLIVMPSLGSTPRPDAFEGGISGPMHPDAHLGGKMTCLWSVTGNPVVSLPCGFTSTERPVSMQMIGPAFRDGSLLQAARAAEAVWSLPRERLVPTWVAQECGVRGPQRSGA